MSEEQMEGFVCDTRTRERGFIFIRGDNGVSHFAHCRGFARLIDFDQAKEGQRVSFISARHADGKGNALRATNIQLVEDCTCLSQPGALCPEHHKGQR